MTFQKRAWILVAALLAGIPVLGWALAALAQPAIEADLRREIVARNIHGMKFGGISVPPEKIQITSTIQYPFVVVGVYFVPFDLHGSYHDVSYLVLPWGKQVFAKDSVYAGATM